MSQLQAATTPENGNNSDPLFQDPAHWTPKDRVFAAMYLKTLNTREAAAACGLPYATCNLMLKKLYVNAYITAQLSAKIMSSLQVETHIGRIAQTSMEDFITLDDSGFPRLDMVKARERGVLGTIRKLKYDAEGRPEFELHDSLKALEILAKRHGLLKEQVEVTGSLDINVQAVRNTVRAAMQDPERLAGMIAIAEELAARSASANVPARLPANVNHDIVDV